MDEFTSKKLIKDMDFVKRTLSSINTTLALQHQSLELHIKRTDLLEKKLEPVERHVVGMNTVFKILGWLGGAGIVVYFLQLVMK